MTASAARPYAGLGLPDDVEAGLTRDWHARARPRAHTLPPPPDRFPRDDWTGVPSRSPPYPYAPVDRHEVYLAARRASEAWAAAHTAGDWNCVDGTAFTLAVADRALEL